MAEAAGFSLFQGNQAAPPLLPHPAIRSGNYPGATVSSATMTASETLRGVEQLAAQIRNRYRSHLRELRIEVVEGGIVLRGRSSSFYGKQMAFHEARSGSQFAVLANQIEVAPARAE